MRYAHIQNGVVDNIVLADSARNGFVQSDTAEIGDAYSDGIFTKPELVSVVPSEVSPAQFRRALNKLDYRNMVEAAIVQSDQNTRDMWEYSLSLHRDNPLLNNMAEQLSITTEQLDEVFILAGSL